jgi:hypothetical protein
MQNVGLATYDNASTIVTGVGPNLVTWEIGSGHRVNTMATAYDGSNQDEDATAVGVGLSRDGRTIVSVSSTTCSVLVCAAINLHIAQKIEV